MEPTTLVALLSFMGTAVSAGSRLVQTWVEGRRQGVAVSSGGSVALQQNFYAPAARASGGGVTPPISVSPRSPAFLTWFQAPVIFDGIFVPADAWARDWLDDGQPVLVTIESRDNRAMFDPLVGLMALGDGFEGQLPPGRYRLGALVFLDEDPNTWDEDTVDGGGLLDFVVEAGEPSFSLRIAIEAVEPQFLIDTGVLSAGFQDTYAAVFEAGYSYSIYVAPDDPEADFDLYILDENGNVVDYDDDLDSDAFCEVTPAWSGPFGIVVRCESGFSAYAILIE